MTFTELYAEGEPAALRDAIADALIALGAERSAQPLNRSRSDFRMRTARRGAMASVVFDGELAFDLVGVVDALIAYARATGGRAGALSGEDELSSVNTRWSEYRAGECEFYGTNQDLEHVLPETWRKRVGVRPGQDVKATEVLAALDAHYGSRSPFLEELHFGPTISPLAGPLEDLVRQAIANGTDVPGFAEVQVRSARTRVRPSAEFIAAVEGQSPAASPHLTELVTRVRALKPYARIAVGPVLVSAHTLESYPGRNPRTGEVIVLPARTLPFFEIRASSPAV